MSNQGPKVVIYDENNNPLLGQQTSAASLPVTIASNQPAITVTATTLALPTGAATAALQTQPGVDIGDVTVNNTSGAGAVNIQDGGNSITVDGTVSVSGSVAVTGPLTDTQLRATPVPVSGTVTAANASVGSTGSAVPSSATATGGSDGTNLQIPRVFDVDSGAGSQYTLGVSLRKAASGGSVEAGTSSDPIRVDPTGATTQPVSATSLPLPTGAATETTLTGVLTTAAFQARVNTLGQKTSANSTPIVIASDQSAIPVSGTVTANVGTTNGLALDTTLAAQSLVDNAAFTDGTSRVVPAGYVFDETAGTALTENDIAASRVDSKRAQVLTLEDATIRGVRATIKAASTAAVATDPALVVAISPNNAITTSNISIGTNNAAIPGSSTLIAGSDGTNLRPLSVDTAGKQNILNSGRSGSGTITALNGTVAANTDGQATVVLSVTGTWTAFLTLEGSTDNGTTWTTLTGITPGSTPQVLTGLSVNAPLVVNCAGFNLVRLRASSFTSGTANVTWVSTVGMGGLLNTTSPDTLSGNALGSLNAAVTVVLAGSAGCGIQLLAGTLIGTIVPEISFDGGTTWTASLFVDPSTGATLSSVAFPTANTATALSVVVVGGASNARVRVSTYTSGTATCYLRATRIASPIGSGTIAGLGSTSFSPDPNADVTIPTVPTVDGGGNIQIRGQVLSDEGSLRDDFSGSSLTTALTGTLSFTNGSDQVVGAGTSFLTELSTDYYVKITVHSETFYARVDSIEDDTHCTLATPYGGATASAASVKSRFITVTPAGGGGAINVASSEVLLLPGTTNGNIAQIKHEGDYLPYVLNFRARITQRIANQTAVIGFQDIPGAAAIQAVLVFTGTVNTQVQFRTSSSSAAADTETTTVTLDAGLDTTQSLLYQIDLSSNVAVLSVNGKIVATHSTHIPGPYDNLSLTADIRNAAAVIATTLALDTFFFSNLDQLQIANSFVGEPIPNKLIGTSGSTITSSSIVSKIPLDVTIVDKQRATYSASAAAITSAATATDIFTITGSATKTIRINRIEISGTQTTGAVRDVLLVKRSTANTAGTSTTRIVVPHDANSATGTATVLAYTANPTLGTLIGAIRSTKVWIPATTAEPAIISWDFSELSIGPVVLRGTAQVLAINLNAVTSTGGSFSFSVEWSEDNS